MTSQRTNRPDPTVGDGGRGSPSYPGGGVAVSARASRSGAWTIVRVEGEMDLRAGPLVADVLDGRAGQVVFDLRGVTFLDACGLGIMIERLPTEEAEARVRLVAPSTPVRRVVELTHTDHLFLVVDPVDGAVAEPLATASRPGG